MRFTPANMLAAMLIAIVMFAGWPSSAATNPTVEITGGGPAAPAGQAPPLKAPNTYLDYLYVWLLGFIGLAALFAIVYGGVLYIFSGAVESTAEARRWITNAFIGLIIAGASYLLLRTINPDLVRKFDIQSIIEKNRSR